jgi:hypothetical protein
MEGSQLKSGVTGAFMVICNDYEFELIRQKTGMSEADILAHAPLLVITKGEKGCTIHTKDGVEDVASVPPDRIEDPTGVGDAFRGGFMKGLATGAPYRVCAQLGSVAATYALEHLGGTSHAYTWDQFKRRYENTSAHCEAWALLPLVVLERNSYSGRRDPDCRPDQALRIDPRPRSRVVRGQARRNPGAHRPQWLRKDDALRMHRRRSAVRCRLDRG